MLALEMAAPRAGQGFPPPNGKVAMRHFRAGFPMTNGVEGDRKMPEADRSHDSFQGCFPPPMAESFGV